MLEKEIVSAWIRGFGGTAPIGYLCREALPSRWVRIHSLPASKRYPQTDADYRELLTRHNTVATQALGSSAACILFVARHPKERGQNSLFNLPDAGGLSLIDIPHLSTRTKCDPQLRISAGELEWLPGRFDWLIRARADDSIGPVLFANLTLGTAYAPYDGGADLFLQSEEQVRIARGRWSQWLSPRSDGL